MTIKMLPQTTFAQRASLYEDVENLIDFGFLTCNMVVNGVRLSLRSLGPGDRFLLRHRILNVTTEQWRILAVASSLWLVDDYNLLGEVNAVPRLSKAVAHLPPNARLIMFNAAMSLFERVNNAMDAVEAYAYEGVSRYKWKSLGGQPFDSHYGLQLGKVGTNHIQRMWTYYNQIEDQRVADDSLWEGFKLTTSAHAPKGIKKLDDKDRKGRQQEQARRQSVQDTFFYTTKGVLEKPKVGEQKPAGPKLMGEKSADDLADEMKRWVTGEADWHDDVVTNYKTMVSQNYARHKQEAADRKARLDAMREADSDMPQTLVAYTPEQLAELLKGKNPGPAGVRQVGSGIGIVREHLYSKYLERQPDSGSIRITQEGRLAVADAEDEEERLSLGQQLAGRQVAFRAGADTESESEEPLSMEW